MILEDVYGYKYGQPPVNPYETARASHGQMSLVKKWMFKVKTRASKEGLTNKQIDEILNK